MSDDRLMRTAIYEKHGELGAKIVPFAGWAMPVVYKSIIAEHQAVRNEVGVFDVSHMGEFSFSGKDAVKVVDFLISNSLLSQGPMKGVYSPMLYENGTFVDDVIAYQIRDDLVYMVVNAANIEKDRAWIEGVLENPKKFADIESEIGSGLEVDFSDISSQKSLLAVQGKGYLEKIKKILPNFEKEAAFKVRKETYKGSELFICFTGYTGEEGVEVMLDNEVALDFFSELVAQGVVPCGLGARDTLRMEKGFSLYGQEITDRTNALEAGLSWTIYWEKSFIGKKALQTVKESGTTRRLRGIVMEERAIARTGCAVYGDDETQIGEVTSGGYSPSLKKNIGLAYIAKDYKGEKVQVQIRDKKFEALLTKRAFC